MDQETIIKLRNELAAEYANSCGLDGFSGNTYNDSLEGYSQGFDAAVEKLYRPALAEIDKEAKVIVEALKRIAALEALAKQMFLALQKADEMWDTPLVKEALDAYKRGVGNGK